MYFAKCAWPPGFTDKAMIIIQRIRWEGLGEMFVLFCIPARHWSNY